MNVSYGIYSWHVIINCQKIITVRLPPESETIKSIQNDPDSDEFSWGENPESTEWSSD